MSFTRVPARWLGAWSLCALLAAGCGDDPAKPSPKPVCGDGQVQGQEACDHDGSPGSTCAYGQMSCMVCDAQCQRVPGQVTGFCGDGQLQADAGEQCDEPTKAACDYGQMSCMVCDAQCKLVPGQVTGFCGDGQLQADAGEQCDEPAKTDCEYGQMSCMVCDAQCQRVPGQVTGFCGDGQLQAASGEQCDGPLDAQTRACRAQGLGYGVLSCKEDCALDDSDCGVIEGLILGAQHTCVRLGTSQLLCWGLNDFGQSGDVPELQSVTPIKVTGLDAPILSGDGALSHTCAVMQSGQVRCWGFNERGQLGDGTTTTSRSPVTALESGATGVSAGDGQTCAVMQGGAVRCWGDNQRGQLGRGTTTLREPSPGDVRDLSDAVQVVVGFGHACARRAGGQVVCWGNHGFGQVGDGSRAPLRSTPVAVKGLEDAIDLSAGDNHTCAVRMSGQVVCWGRNDFGQLGDGTQEVRYEPVAVQGLTQIVGLSAGSEFTCARHMSGEVSCWGHNLQGQLGDGTFMNRATPVSVMGAQDIVEIVAGYRHLCVRDRPGVVSCVGFNAYGQLGDGATMRSATLKPVSTLD